MSSELGLDPSDPLNLLLHNSVDPSTDRDPQDDNAQAWSSLSTLWSDPAPSMDSSSSKAYTDMMPIDFSDLSASLHMDMDFNQSMAIEPSALHFDPTKFAQMNFAGYDDQYGLPSDVLAAQFPFTFQFGGVNELGSSGSSVSSISDAASSPQSFVKERRLSVTSSSSSSGASLSPVPESLPSPATGGYTSDTNAAQPKEEPVPHLEVLPSPTNSYAGDPAAALAARVRQAAGVMLAVPMGAQIQGYTASMYPNSSQPKLPIPRLPRHPPTASKSSSSSAASTPPPSTPPHSGIDSASTGAPLKLALNGHYESPPSDPSASYAPAAPAPATAAGPARPKTSHTTIERRYRTNLNARIQSLRMAVPALRVLEDREGGNGKKIKKNLKGNVIIKGSSSESPTPSLEADDGTPIDVIDERGFVDGVKVARKCSKANVLGKAVEYIRVLKRRELRLKREQAGLKTLVAGLVGGAALVKEWEREWREMFGGEERDEVEGELGEGAEEGEGNEDGEEEDEDSEEEDERRRKKAKLSAAAAASRKAAAAEKKKAAASAAASLLPLTLRQAESTAPGAASSNPAPEKRKRGRPRKVPPPPPVTAASAQSVHQQPGSELNNPDAMVQDEQMGVVGEEQQQWLVQHPQGQAHEQQQQQGQPQQYLLAVFALFSFFNSPLTSSSSSSSSSFFGFSSAQQQVHHHTHTGTVLSQPPLAYAPEIVAQFTPPPPPPPPPPSTLNNATLLAPAGWSWTWQECIQAFHLLVSVLVLFGLVASWAGWDFRLGARVLGYEGRGRDLVKKGRGRSLSVRSFRAARESNGKERRKGPEGWVVLGAESVLRGQAYALSLYDNMRIYRACTSVASPSALTTLALVLHGGKSNTSSSFTRGLGPLALLRSLKRMRAEGVWEGARRAAAATGAPAGPGLGASAKSTAHALVFEEVKGVDEAAEMLSRHLPRAAKSQMEEQQGREVTPLDILARRVVKARVKRHLGKLFVRAVALSSSSSSSASSSPLLSEYEYHHLRLPQREDSREDDGEEEKEKEEESWRRTIEAARELGGRVERLGRVFERVWKAPGGGVDESEIEALFGSSSSEVEEEVEERQEGEEEGEEDGELRALLVALVLYRRLFASEVAATAESQVLMMTTQEEEEGCVTPTAMGMGMTDNISTSTSASSLLSPPPSPRSTPRARQAKFSLDADADGEQEQDDEGGDGDEDEDEDEEAKAAAAERKRMLFVLRRALGSRVFELRDVDGREGGGGGGGMEKGVLGGSGAIGGGREEVGGLELELELEDAKDRVVDLIVDVERREKRRSGAFVA